MDFILITFVYGDIAEDLKIPARVPVGETLDAFNEIYGGAGTTLHALPKGIILDLSKTFEEQGIGHGTLLTLS